MIEIISSGIFFVLIKIFSYLKDNWMWIVFDITIFTLVVTWLSNVFDSTEKSRMRKWEYEDARFKRFEELLKRQVQCMERIEKNMRSER